MSWDGHVESVCSKVNSELPLSYIVAELRTNSAQPRTNIDHHVTLYVIAFIMAGHA